MSKRKYDPNARYQKIPSASKTTGLSQYYLRKGCKDGTIPHIKTGPVYMIDVPALYEELRKTQGTDNNR